MSARMPRPKGSNTHTLNLLVPPDWMKEAEQLTAPLSEPGVNLTRADVLRKALRRGLDELKRDTQARTKKGPKR
jgi:hypothetical protein